MRYEEVVRSFLESQSNKEKNTNPHSQLHILSHPEVIPNDSGRKENWYIRFITLCMSNFNIPGEHMNLGDHIQQARKKAQLSQEKLGDMVGVTRQTISNWELNITTPDANQLLALSKALQVSMDALMENDIQHLIEQKVNVVETQVSKNNTLLLCILIALMVLFILMFIMNA
jgi:transcriptional regulator with XRE-family HTH domain